MTDRPPQSRRPRYTLAAALLAAVMVGCNSSRPEPVSAPPFSASDAAKQALADYDTNKDGLLDKAELARCPGLLWAFALYDTNKDGKLSASELEDRMKSFSDVGLVTANFTFHLDGGPLEGATVTCVPEKFMGPAFKPATGTTDRAGIVVPVAEGAGLSGMPFGVYRIEVSKKNSAGQETIPARYNAHTVLGVELNAGTRSTFPTFNLTRR
jgi:hypothetical protein